jgi:acid phosphatase family membrane protein YuiD
MPKTYATDYYKQYVPYFNQGATASGSGGQMNNLNKNQLLEKLNYMIHLLEEQKDEKTGHVMEEVILYSFLGVFIIFIVDSFARVGKYTR